MYTYTMLDVLASVCVAFILATCVCKFLHACVASYTHVYASKIFMRVFVSALCVLHVCPTHVDFVLYTCVSHAWNVRVTCVNRLSSG